MRHPHINSKALDSISKTANLRELTPKQELQWRAYTRSVDEPKHDHQWELFFYKILKKQINGHIGKRNLEAKTICAALGVLESQDSHYD